MRVFSTRPASWINCRNSVLNNHGSDISNNQFLDEPGAFIRRTWLFFVGHGECFVQPLPPCVNTTTGELCCWPESSYRGAQSCLLRCSIHFRIIHNHSNDRYYLYPAGQDAWGCGTIYEYCCRRHPCLGISGFSWGCQMLHVWWVDVKNPG